MAWAGVVIATALPAAAADTPKRGGTLTYMIPADAPPSFDAHRETTFATVHSAAPFYSVLIRVNPDNPSSTTDFVCDLCTEMPTPTDNGTTYTLQPSVKLSSLAVGDKVTVNTETKGKQHLVNKVTKTS